MRLPIESFADRVRGLVLMLVLAPALAACGSHAELASAPPVPRTNGPAADYPVVIGAPYKIGDKLYTPVDTMNYDEVGYLAVDGGTGITAAHHTLPLPSYAEVTSLKTGHTILVRVERRGPMSGNQLIALSPAALAQLGAAAGDPVRVRRVNPPEIERAALRAGRTAPSRMDTPASLVAVLKQKLPEEGEANLVRPKSAAPASLASVEVPASTAKRAAIPAAAKPAPAAVQTNVARSSPPPLPPLPSRGSGNANTGPAAVVVARLQQPQPAARAVEPRPVRASPQAAPAASEGAYGVQAATMSTLARARKVAGSIDGSVSKAGKYFRVRTGPFATREQAEASLAKVRAAGYSDARIFTNG